MTAALLHVPLQPPRIHSTSLLAMAGVFGGLLGAAGETGGQVGGLDPTTTLIGSLVASMSGVLIAFITSRRRRNKNNGNGADDDSATVPLSAYNAMRDQMQARIDELEHQLRTRGHR